MAETKKASEIGLGQAKLMCNMKLQQRLEFISEGLPIIFESARSLMAAARALEGFPREVEILQGHAVEECAKILILIDIVRCPQQVIASRLGPMIKWFYDHLARLIYAESQSWKPISIGQLQEYVDSERKSHYLEGEYGEYIMPNWKLFSRESSLYADVIGNEDADPSWNSPVRPWLSPSLQNLHAYGSEPPAYCLARALEAVGLFTLSGLKLLNEVWGSVNFERDQDWDVSRRLFSELASKLDAGNFVTDKVTEQDAAMLHNSWQMPMYHIDFSRIDVSLERLRDQQERNLPYD